MSVLQYLVRVVRTDGRTRRPVVGRSAAAVLGGLMVAIAASTTSLRRYSLDERADRGVVHPWLLLLKLLVLWIVVMVWIGIIDLNL